MALSDLLNADMATTGAQLRVGWSWWLGELGGMVPHALRGEAARTRAVAELHGAEAIFWRDGHRLAAAPARAAIALPRAQALVRDVMLPRLPRADTRRLLALDLDRLTALDPAAAVFDFVVLPGEPPGGRQQVRLAVVTRATAVSALARADALGVTPQALGLMDGVGGVQFDFLPNLDQDASRGPLWARASSWWIAAGVLLLANLAFAIWRDMADVSRLSDIVAAQSDAVQLAQRARSRVRAEDFKRAAWSQRRAVQDPLPPLTVATVALPSPVWVQRLAWDGHALRLTGYTTEAIDPIALLRRSPMFSAVHASTSDVAPALPQFQSFDLNATVAVPTATTSVSTTTTTRGRR